VLVLVVEVCVLTPFVEFSSGPMEYVADPRVCTGFLFALVTFLFFSSREIRDLVSASAKWTTRPAPWLAANLSLYLVFFLYTLWMASKPPLLSPWAAASAWVLLGAGIALTSLLAFLPGGMVCRWIWQRPARVLLAALLGFGLVLASSWLRGSWPYIHGPALAIDRVLIEWTYGQSVTGTTAEGFPVLGTQRLRLLVTPQCSEIDALATFGLLGCIVACTRWRRLRRGRIVLVLLLGAAAVYLLNAVRIYGLVVVAHQLSPRLCVALAHSRLGWLFFLGLSALVLAGTFRWCSRPALGAARME
jgi:exosortase/archaeosortase family protein